MNVIELTALAVAGLTVVVLLSMVGYFNYVTSKYSNKLPEPKNYPPCKFQTERRIFEDGSWRTVMYYGTSEEIAEKVKEWNKITDKNLAEYKKSAKIRDMITLRKKLKERHHEWYYKQR